MRGRRVLKCAKMACEHILLYVQIKNAYSGVSGLVSLVYISVVTGTVLPRFILLLMHCSFIS